MLDVREGIDREKKIVTYENKTRIYPKKEKIPTQTTNPSGDE